MRCEWNELRFGKWEQGTFLISQLLLLKRAGEVIWKTINSFLRHALTIN